MIVYHGGVTAVQVPKIIPAEIGRDFGFAFYTTDIKAQGTSREMGRAQSED